MRKFIALLIAVLLISAMPVSAASTYNVKTTRKRQYPRTITVKTDGVEKKYKLYDQNGFSSSYLSQRGCAHTAAAIVMSAYGKSYTPYNIHYGSSGQKCSERYALKKLKKRVAVTGQSLSIFSISKILRIHYGSSGQKCSERYALKKLKKRVAVTGQSLSIFSISKILRNAGIKNRAVYKYNENTAIREITANLEKGRPVIVMCHRKRVKGVKLANSYHMLVLAGIDKKGNVIALNPAGGTVNTSHCTGRFKLTVKQIVRRHMWSCRRSKYKSFYFNGADNYGGYILIK